MCKSWCEAIIGLVIAVFALFWYNAMYTKWVIVIAAVILIIHSFTCKSCFNKHAMKEMSSEKSSKKKK